MKMQKSLVLALTSVVSSACLAGTTAAWQGTAGGDMCQPSNWGGKDPAGLDLYVLDSQSAPLTLSADLVPNLFYLGADVTAEFALSPFKMTPASLYGYGGSDVTLSSGSVVSGSAYFGYDGGANSKFTVTGSETVLTLGSANNSLNIGYAAGNHDNTLVVSGGARLVANGRTGHQGGYRNRIVVTGANSTWSTSGGMFNVGVAGATGSQEHEIAILDGGKFEGLLALPAIPGSVSNRLVVAGAGSRFAYADPSFVLGAQSGSDYTALYVTNHADATFGELWLGGVEEGLSAHTLLRIADWSEPTINAVRLIGEACRLELDNHSSLTLPVLESKGAGTAVKVSCGSSLTLQDALAVHQCEIHSGSTASIVLPEGSLLVAASVGQGGENSLLSIGKDSRLEICKGCAPGLTTLVVDGGRGSNRVVVDGGEVENGGMLILGYNTVDSIGNEVVVRNGGRFVNHGQVYVGRKGAASRIDVENGSFIADSQITASREGSSSYVSSSNAVVRVAGTNGTITCAGTVSLSSTATIVVDLGKGTCVDAMLKANSFTFAEGARIFITSTQPGFDDCEAFTATVLKQLTGNLNLTGVTLDVDPRLRIEVVRDGDGQTLKVSHRPERGLIIILGDGSRREGLHLSMPSGSVPLLSDRQKGFYALTQEARVNGMTDADVRAQWKLCTGDPKPVTVSWQWTDPQSGRPVDHYDVSLRKTGGDVLERRSVAYSKTSFGNLEVGCEYEVSVSVFGTGNEPYASATGSFRTEETAPRLIKLDGTFNIRDLGGRRGLGGKRVRQGLVYRGGRLNPNSTVYRDDQGVITNGTPSPSALPAASTAYMHDVMGIRTDLDLRDDAETYGMTNSPLGDGVAWVHSSAGAYGAVTTDSAAKAAFAQQFAVFLDSKNYPIYFHCMAGADRTGTLAYILDGLLGVDEGELWKDWETNAFIDTNPDFRHAGRMFVLSENFNALPGATLAEKIEAFVKARGFTDADIATFRSLMLEG